MTVNPNHYSNGTRRFRRVLMFLSRFIYRIKTSIRTRLHSVHLLEPIRVLTSARRTIITRPRPLWPAAGTDDSIVVLTANLWHDWPRHRRLPERLESFARLVESEGAQVVLLQEVIRNAGLRADEWLAERLGMGFAYTRANGHAGAIGFEEGVAVLSRFPISEPTHLCMQPSNVPFVNRVALGTRLETPCGDIWAFSTHLGILKNMNAAQIAHLHSWVMATSGSATAMIGGDFNTAESSPQMGLIRENWVDLYRHLNSPGEDATYELRMPWGGSIWRARLDYLFLQPGAHPWKITDARHVGGHPHDYSDHQSVVARIQCARRQGPDLRHHPVFTVN